jgi:hypothetical protein
MNGCPALRLGVRATDASDSRLPESQFYECLIPQLYNDQRSHQALGYRTPADLFPPRVTKEKAIVIIEALPPNPRDLAPFFPEWMFFGFSDLRTCHKMEEA